MRAVNRIMAVFSFLNIKNEKTPFPEGNGVTLFLLALKTVVNYFTIVAPVALLVIWVVPSRVVFTRVRVA